MFALKLSALPRLDSFDDAERFFNGNDFRFRDYPDIKSLSRRGDATKTIRREISGDVSAPVTAYIVKYHQTDLIMYSRGPFGERLHIDTGHNSRADRGILDRMTPFRTDSYKKRTIVNVNGDELAFDAADFVFKDKRWEVDKLYGHQQYMQLVVVRPLSATAKQIHADIVSWHKMKGSPTIDSAFMQREQTMKTMYEIALGCLISPEAWKSAAKILLPSEVKAFNRYLHIAERGVVKRPVPYGDLPRKCVYDNYEEIVRPDQSGN